MPSQLQFKLFTDGIDPSIVDPEIRQIIKNLGYNNDDEINVELSSPGYTPSKKVFYLMLNKRAAYKLLQWDESGQSKNAELFFPLMVNDAPVTESLKNELLDGFESPPIHYLIQMPIVHFEYENPFDRIAIELQRLMKGLQSFLTENCFKWFHQSDMELISKSFNSNLLVLISCSFQTKEAIILKISLIQGSQDEIVQLTKQIRNCISFLSSGCTTKFIKYP